MTAPDSLHEFALRLRAWIERFGAGADTGGETADAQFDQFARELFALQFEAVAPYRKLCQSRQVTPGSIGCWSEIPAVPAAAFKEFDLTSLRPDQRTRVFHSSGTTEQRPSRHFHSARSLDLYESSLLPWFQKHLLADLPSTSGRMPLLILTPSPSAAIHSSLVHMFETVRQSFGAESSCYAGALGPDGAWTVEVEKAIAMCAQSVRLDQPLLLLGTAFSFVHLLDALEARGLRLPLPRGSRLMETGGYKGRSRALPKSELHAMVTRVFGMAPDHLVTEYGMSELNSQAYDLRVGRSQGARCFRFPPWARDRIISPETGAEVPVGERGLLRVFDLANAHSVMAIQTEDVAVRCASGFELLGRAGEAEARGCSLMSR
jgi:hypothetical protein